MQKIHQVSTFLRLGLGKKADTVIRHYAPLVQKQQLFKQLFAISSSDAAKFRNQN